MIKKTCLITASITLLSACSLFHNGLGNKPIVDESHDLAIQDPHWRRFYELEQEIAQLKSRLNAKSAETPKSKFHSHQEPSTAQSTGDTSDFLAKLRAQTEKAVAAIDNAIESLETVSTEPEQEAPAAAIAGTLRRGEQGKVLQQVSHTQARKPAYRTSGGI